MRSLCGLELTATGSEYLERDGGVGKAEEDALWVYWVTTRERRPVRKVTWAFVNEDDGKDEIWLACMQPGQLN
jgi:hypothetical protein